LPPVEWQRLSEGPNGQEGVGRAPFCCNLSSRTCQSHSFRRWVRKYLV